MELTIILKSQLSFSSSSSTSITISSSSTTLKHQPQQHPQHLNSHPQQPPELWFDVMCDSINRALTFAVANENGVVEGENLRVVDVAEVDASVLSRSWIL
jgi:hypothetical protein